jgi:hypothetical protein
MLNVFEDPASSIITVVEFKGIELTSKDAVWRELDNLVDYLLTHPNTDPTSAKEDLKYLIESLNYVGGLYYCPNIPKVINK